MQNKLSAYRDFFTPHLLKRLAIAGLLFWLPVGIFVGLADEVLEPEPLPFDGPLLSFVQNWATSQTTSLMILLTRLGGITFIILASVLVIALLVYLRKKRAAALVLLATSGAGLMNVLFKLIFQRDRPDAWTTLVVEDSYSFPSGHAMGSAALAFSLVALAWHTSWRWPSVIVGGLYVFGVGLTRVYLGVHYPSDVVAGWCVSLAWTIIIYKIVLRGFKKLAV